MWFAGVVFCHLCSALSWLVQLNELYNPENPLSLIAVDKTEYAVLHACMLSSCIVAAVFLLLPRHMSRRRWCRVSAMAWLTASYWFLFKAAPVFASFQWDLLLLEASYIGIVHSLCTGGAAESSSAQGSDEPYSYTSSRGSPAPLSAQQQQQQQQRGDGSNGTPPFVTFLWRWLLFRLMLSSGLVKLLSRDYLWWSLDATLVHHETTCLPSYLAFWVHRYVPPAVHRLSTAAVFVVELLLPIPAFFVPTRSIVLVNAVAQILLQLSIMLTGHYGFFNVLTIVIAGLTIGDSSSSSSSSSSQSMAHTDNTTAPLRHAEQSRQNKLSGYDSLTMPSAARPPLLTKENSYYGQRRRDSTRDVKLEPGEETASTRMDGKKSINEDNDEEVCGRAGERCTDSLSDSELSSAGDDAGRHFVRVGGSDSPPGSSSSRATSSMRGKKGVEHSSPTRSSGEDSSHEEEAEDNNNRLGGSRVRRRHHRRRHVATAAAHASASASASASSPMSTTTSASASSSSSSSSEGTTSSAIARRTSTTTQWTAEDVERAKANALLHNTKSEVRAALTRLLEAVVLVVCVVIVMEAWTNRSGWEVWTEETLDRVLTSSMLPSLVVATVMACWYAMRPQPSSWHMLGTVLGLMLFVASCVPFVARLVPKQTRSLPVPFVSLYRTAALPLVATSSYGLFASMVSVRQEVVMEIRRRRQKTPPTAAADSSPSSPPSSSRWVEHVWPYKPSRVDIAPPWFVAPHQPRAEWQMWFVPFAPQRAQSWLVPLAAQVMDQYDPAQYDALRVTLQEQFFANETSPKGHWWWRKPRPKKQKSTSPPPEGTAQEKKKQQQQQPPPPPPPATHILTLLPASSRSQVMQRAQEVKQRLGPVFKADDGGGWGHFVVATVGRFLSKWYNPSTVEKWIPPSVRRQPAVSMLTVLVMHTITRWL